MQYELVNAKCIQNFGRNTSREGDYFGYLRVDGRIILKLILQTEPIWCANANLIHHTDRQAFVNGVMNLRVPLQNFSFVLSYALVVFVDSVFCLRSCLHHQLGLTELLLRR